MCELLGLNFKLPVSPSFSFRGFRHRSDGNPHGWGIARYEGKACQILKEAADAQESKLAEFVRDYELFQSRIFIGHVREATRGGNTLNNTHPFKRVFGSREVVLAHNGTMESLPLVNRGNEFPSCGETDSEQLFCSLLTLMAADKIQFTDFLKIEKILQEFNKLGKMNLFFPKENISSVIAIKTDITDSVSTERISPFGVKISSRTRIGRSIWQLKKARVKGVL